MNLADQSQSRATDATTAIIETGDKQLGDLYDKVVRKYARQLEAMRPVVEIPVTI
jgi:hypothetical protein